MLWDLQGRYPVSTVMGPKEGCHEINTGLHLHLILVAGKVLPTEVSQGWELEAEGAGKNWKGSSSVYSLGKLSEDGTVDEAEQQWAGFTAKVPHGLRGKERTGRWRDSWLRAGEMALWVKHLEPRHENLSSDLQHTGKQPGVVARQIPGAHWPVSLAVSGLSGFR